MNEHLHLPDYVCARLGKIRDITQTIYGLSADADELIGEEFEEVNRFKLGTDIAAIKILSVDLDLLVENLIKKEGTTP